MYAPSNASVYCSEISWLTLSSRKAREGYIEMELHRFLRSLYISFFYSVDDTSVIQQAVEMGFLDGKCLNPVLIKPPL